MLQACAARHPDHGLREWAQGFEGAYPYLKLIAEANRVDDPLRADVVEAYWLGNKLLAAVDMSGFHGSLRERFAPRLSPKLMDLVLGKVPAGAEPFHTFHVLDVCRRTGALEENLEVLDSCRISWGRVLTVDGDEIDVSAEPLVYAQGKMALGSPQKKRVRHRVDGHSFVSEVQPGDWVSLHWDWPCDRLTAEQVQRLRFHTQRHIDLANLTL